MRDDGGRVQYHFVLVDYLLPGDRRAPAPGSDVSEAVVADPADLDAVSR